MRLQTFVVCLVCCWLLGCGQAPTQGINPPVSVPSSSEISSPLPTPSNKPAKLDFRSFESKVRDDSEESYSLLLQQIYTGGDLEDVDIVVTLTDDNEHTQQQVVQFDKWRKTEFKAVEGFNKHSYTKMTFTVIGTANCNGEKVEIDFRDGWLRILTGQ